MLMMFLMKSLLRKHMKNGCAVYEEHAAHANEDGLTPDMKSSRCSHEARLKSRLPYSTRQKPTGEGFKLGHAEEEACGNIDTADNDTADGQG